MASIYKNFSVMTQIRRINRELNAVTKNCEEPIRDTLLTQAALVAAEQRSLAPVGEDSDSPGAARDSIRVVEGAATAKKPFVIKILAGGETTRKQGPAGTYDYVRAVVFGTEKSAPFDFFFSVWRARKKAAKAAVRKAVKVAVGKTFR